MGEIVKIVAIYSLHYVIGLSEMYWLTVMNFLCALYLIKMVRCHDADGCLLGLLKKWSKKTPAHNSGFKCGIR